MHWNRVQPKTLTPVLLLLLGMVLLAFVRITWAAPNYQINYQGKLADNTGATVADGSYGMRFRLYTAASGGVAIWDESSTSTVQNGLFSIMLGSTTPLTSVDFNQTLYLGVTVGNDSEMTPRKIIGTVPAAFIAQTALDANTVGGVASTSFLRNDQAATSSASTNGTLLSIEQNGSGNILDLWGGATKYFTVLSNGNVGIGTSSPQRNLSIDGDMQITGGLYDNNNTRGSNNMILRSTGAGLEWVATSTLGFVDNSDLANYLPLTGGTLSGNLSFSGTAANIALGSNWLSGDGDDEGIQLDTAGRVRIQTLNGAEAGFWLRNSATTDGSSMSLIFEGATGTDVSKIQSILRGSVSNADLIFSNNQSGVLTEMLRVSHTGEILMGTTSGNALLTVRATGTKDIFNLHEASGSEVFTVLESGSVGIGSTTPSATLAVAGDAYITGTLRDSSGAAGTSGMVLKSTGTGFTWVATSTLGFVDNSDLASYLPLTGGTLSGNLSFSGTAANIALGSNWLSGDGDDEGISVGSTGRVFINNTTSYSTDDLLTITNQGGYTAMSINAHSATAWEGATLNVRRGRGTISSPTVVQNNDLIFQLHPVARGNSAWNGVADMTVDVDGTFTGNNIPGRFTFFTANSSGVQSEVMRINSQGRVGIGTTSPNQLLSIFRNGADAAIEFSTVSGSAEKWTVGIDDSDSAKFKISSSSALGTSDRLVINGSGYVGIGSSSPLHTLSVAGDVYVTGALYDNTNSAGSNGMVLKSTGTGFTWVATSTLGLGGSGATTLDALTDVDTTGVASGNILAYNGSSWVDFATSTFLMESELNTEAELEALLGDVSDVFTSNANDITSAELITAVSDETGSGNLVFSAAPTFTGTTNLASLIASASSTIANFNFTTATGTTLVLGGDTITDINGTGLSLTAGVLSTTLGTAIDESELNISGSPTNGYVLQASSTAAGGFVWVATSTLGLASSASLSNYLPLSGGTLSGNLSFSGTAANIALGSNWLSGDGDDEGIFIDSSGYVGIGTSTPNAPLTIRTSTGGSMSFYDQYGEFQFRRSSDSSAGPLINMFKSRGTSNAPAAVQTDDILFDLNGRGYRGTSGYNLSTSIRGHAAATFTNTSSPTYLSFFTTPSASVTQQERVRISANGNVGIGSTTPSAALAVAGDAYITGTLRDSSGAAGTSGMVLKSTGTGFTWVATSTLGFTSSLLTDAGATTYLTSTTDALAVGTTTAVSNAKLTVWGGGIQANNLGTPTVAGTYNTPNSAVAATVSGRYAYVADGSSLQIVDVADVAKTSLAGSIGLGGSVNEVAVAGHYAYVADYTYGLRIVDVSNPATPRLVGTYDTSGNAKDVVVSGKYAYVADDGSGLQVIDISDPTTPTLADNYDTGAAEALTISGHYVYLADSLNDLYILDVTDPTAVQLVDTYNGTGSGYDVAVNGGYAYLANLSGGLQIIDISDPTTPTLAGTYDTAGNARGIDVAGDYAYVGDHNSGLVVINVASSTAPTLVGTYASSGSLRHLSVAGRYLYTGYDTNGLVIFDIDGSEFSSLFAGSVTADQAQVETDLIIGNSAFLGGGLTVSTNALIGGALTVTGNASSSLLSANTNPSFIVESGYVGIGTTTPTQTLTVDGDVRFDGALYDNTNSAGSNGMVLKSTGTGFTWVATSTLGLGGSGATTLDALTDVDTTGVASGNILAYNGSSWVDFATSTFLMESELNTEAELETLLGGTDVVTITADDITSANLATALSNETGTGNVVFSDAPTLTGIIDAVSADFSSTLTMSGSAANIALGTNYLSGDGNDEGIYIDGNGNVGIGTTTPESLLGINKVGITGNTTAGINEYFGLSNVTNGATVYGDRTYIKNSSTATTTIVGGIIRIEDSQNFGNTVRGFEVQTHRGTTTRGENTALSGFARTFGVRGTTEGDAGGTYEPAGGFFQTKGTTQGNAIRGYSASITTADLLSLFQDTSTFAGTGLLMNFGNSGGSFSSTTSKFVDFQNAGTSKFTVSAHGTTTIGDGTTNNLAGLKVGYGGICVDNDGTCNPTLAGRIYSVSQATGNSDVAEVYFSSQTLQPGEVVVADGFLSVARATEATAERVLGVVSTKPGLILGSDDTSLIAGQQSYPLALMGRVPVRLSTENGTIAVGDPLTLSSIPGVAMKAKSGDYIIGRALEGFDGTYAYTEGFVNQFGDDIAEPNYEAEHVNTDSRINDGCTFGGGGATGEADENCDPETFVAGLADTSEEEEAARRFAALQAALEALKVKPAESAVTAVGQAVRIGQVTMFVERGFHFGTDTLTVLEELTSTSTELVLGAEEDSGETLWGRLKELAQNFVGGVLKIAGLKADKIETSELCVDDVCVDAVELKALLEASNNSGQIIQVVPTTSTGSTGPTVTTGGEGNEAGPGADEDTATSTQPEPAPLPQSSASSTQPSATDPLSPVPEPPPTSEEASVTTEATAESESEPAEPEPISEPEPTPPASAESPIPAEPT